MHYTRIELKGYRRLQLSNIQIIRMEPKQVIQLILGTNGSGKSSLLREITPLPSSHTQYEKDGYKLLEMTHKGFQYRALSSFDGKGGKYSLTKDGNEIFQGSTVTDYKALIKQEFGITPDIQMLVDGVVRFSTMDLAKRRQWFTMLSNADYTFAFKYYNQLRTRIRDLQGAATIAQNRYVNELSKVLSAEDIEGVRAQLEVYRGTMHKLLEQKPRVSVLRTDIEHSLNLIDQQFEPMKRKVAQLQQAIVRSIPTHYATSPISIEFIEQELYRLRRNTESFKNFENEAHLKLDSLLTQADSQELIQSVSIEEREKICVELRDEIVRLENSRHTSERIPNISEFKSSFETVYDHLQSILEALPEDNRQHFLATLEIQKERKTGNVFRLNQLDAAITRAQEDIQQMEHAKKHHMRTCPSCSHSWYHGYEETRYQSIKASLTQNIAEKDKIQEHIENCDEIINETIRVMDLRTRYSRLIRNWPHLDVLWSVIDEVGGTNYPKKSLSVIREFLIDIPIMVRVDSLCKELLAAENILCRAREQGDIDLDLQREAIVSAEKDLVNTQAKIRQFQERERSLVKLAELLRSVTAYIDTYNRLDEERQSHLSVLQDTVKVEYFNDLIALFRQELAGLEQTISKIDIQQNVIGQLQSQIAEYQEQIRLLKLAEQALSPSSGLIAKGLTGFINWFISKMNGFVSHIWTYPLEILPIAVTDDLELDYKFPVSVDNGKPATDVKSGECNSATCEVFDLAFRIMAMECLGLGAYPLQLDEFGASFDHRHRNTGFGVVTGLIASSDIPQVFMVSHNEQSYGSLQNVDITVLHSDNISLPGGAVQNNQTYIG